MNRDQSHEAAPQTFPGLGVPRRAVEAQVTAAALTSQAIVLVEGVSDRVAIETLAKRRGRAFDQERISVVAIGGATNIGYVLELLQGRVSGVRLAGLCDAGEQGAFSSALERAGFGSDLTRPAMEALGFYVCVVDLEDELIRALGTDTVERLIESEGELGSFRVFQRQPAQRGRSVEAQQRRFLGTRSGRKIRYAALLVGALAPTEAPRPLEGVVAYV